MHAQSSVPHSNVRKRTRYLSEVGPRSRIDGKIENKVVCRMWIHVWCVGMHVAMYLTSCMDAAVLAAVQGEKNDVGNLEVTGDQPC